MKFRLLVKAVIAIFPNGLKTFCYRHLFGYTIGKRVRIGVSIIDVAECRIANDVVIGHFNIFTGTKSLVIGDHSRIGHFNIFRGGDEIDIGRYCEILRLNEINSIPEPDIVNIADPRFILGDGSMIGASHKIDFTDRVELGKRVILGGRNSSLWTHNRQMTRPITIGDFTYIGSEIRIAPGGSVAPKCIVGIGAVITKSFENEYRLIGGLPATELKELDEDGRFLTERKTRNDLPDDI